MVGRLLFPFGMAYFQGRTISFRGCSRQGFIIQPTILIKRGGLATVKAPYVFFCDVCTVGGCEQYSKPWNRKRNCTWKHAITCHGKNMERDCERKHQFVVAYAYPRHPIILLMEEIRLTTWDIPNLVNNRINYQPQLVNAGFLNHQHYLLR